MFCLRIVLLLFLAAGTLADDGFDLFDALGPDPTPAKPKEPKVDPEKPKSDGELDLLDAFGLDPTPAKPDVPKVPEKPKPDGGELDLFDALGPDPEPAKPKEPKVPVKPGTGGKELSDSDLFDITGDYKPDGGRSGGAGGAGGGGRAQDPGYNPQGGGGGDDQPKAAGTGQIAGIVSTIGVALLGAASGYFAYQKKKLCFKLQGGQDPEMGKGHRGNQNDNQLFSNLLRTS